MTGTNWVSIIALAGWLVLMIGAFRSYRLGTRKALTIGLIWAAIFLLVTAIIAGVRGGG